MGAGRARKRAGSMVGRGGAEGGVGGKEGCWGRGRGGGERAGTPPRVWIGSRRWDSGVRCGGARCAGWCALHPRRCSVTHSVGGRERRGGRCGAGRAWTGPEAHAPDADVPNPPRSPSSGTAPGMRRWTRPQPTLWNSCLHSPIRCCLSRSRRCVGFGAGGGGRRSRHACTGKDRGCRGARALCGMLDRVPRRAVLRILRGRVCARL